MTSQPTISVHQAGKTYRIWENPSARLTTPLLEAAARFLPSGDRLRRHAARNYRDFHALSNVSFTVGQGQSFAIIGRNGSGKSTLLQIIAGTLHPTHGQIAVHGRVAALLELGSGFNPDFTGRENIYLYGSILGLPRETIEERFDAIAQFADIGAFIEQPVKTYSSGMALRLAFAVIAHVDASVLIIDEALAVGDVYFSQKCMRFFSDFKKRGTLLFVSHDMSAVRALCDSALWLENGNARMIGSAQDVAAAYLAEFNLSQKNRDVASADLVAKDGDAAAGFSAAVATQEGVPKPDNPLTVSAFNAQSSSFGDGLAKIVDAHFCDAAGVRLTTIRGGEIVCLSITGQGVQSTKNILFGFNLKDRLGQYLFGDNTFQIPQRGQVVIHPGEKYEAKFVFQMPLLNQGNYSVAAAIASGTPENHRQQHWLHEALVISSSLNWAHAGLVGLPMLQISVEKQAAN